MIGFSVLYKNINFLGEAQYIDDESSFYYKPWNYVDYALVIGNGYNSLDVNLKTMNVVQLTGLNPKRNWIKKNLSVPYAQPGELLVLLNENYQGGTGVQYAKNWETYFNLDTGWICIGNPNYASTDKAVIFANNTVAVVREKTLLSVWIRPRFI